VDESVKAALAKWPNVPHAYGWLSLDARGQWFIKGSRVDNAVIADFIGRNYTHDERGRWFFQNGPQRVYVALAAAPWVLAFTDTAHSLVTHTGVAVQAIHAATQDAQGRLFLVTDLGPAALDDRALATAIPLIDDSGATPCFCWQGARHPIAVVENAADGLGFVAEPRPAPGEPEC
jgi:hypothetical protein